MYPITIILAQIFGILLTVSSLAFLINPDKLRSIYEDVKRVKALIFIDGTTGLFFGTLLILFHNIWNSYLASVISAMGWLMFAIGVLELLLPHKTLFKIYSKLENKKVNMIVLFVFLALGLYLALSGFGVIKPV